MSESIGLIGRRSGARSQRAARSPAKASYPLDRDGLARLVLELGDDVRACLEMMSGALWVRDQLVACGWQVEVADARKVKTVAPLAAKTDKVDARVLAELSRRQLVPALWLPSLDERALRERLRRRMHLVRLRTSAKGRIFGLQTQWGVRIVRLLLLGPLVDDSAARVLETGVDAEGRPVGWTLTALAAQRRNVLTY